MVTCHHWLTISCYSRYKACAHRTSITVTHDLMRGTKGKEGDFSIVSKISSWNPWLLTWDLGQTNHHGYGSMGQRLFASWHIWYISMCVGGFEDTRDSFREHDPSDLISATRSCLLLFPESLQIAPPMRTNPWIYGPLVGATVYMQTTLPPIGFPSRVRWLFSTLTKEKVSVVFFWSCLKKKDKNQTKQIMK